MLKVLCVVVKCGFESVLSVCEEDLWCVFLFEWWLSMRWASAKRACDEYIMEWLWDVVMMCLCYDV